MSTEREQRLVSILFECVMVSHAYHKKEMTNEQLAEWVRAQLKGCGFPTKPVGASWGVLCEEWEMEGD
jgi:hypothetical protein